MSSFLSRFIRLLLIILIILGLFVAFLPTIASTDWGRKQVVYWINRSIPGKIEIQKLDVRWGRGQVLEGVLLKDPDGHTVMEIEKVSTEAALWQLLSKNIHLGITKIQDFNAVITTDEKGWTNLQKALGIFQTVDIAPLSQSTIILSDVNMDLYLFAENHPLSAFIKGSTRQDNLNGSFDINIALNGLKASDWEVLKKDAQDYLSIEGSKEAKVLVRIVNFPVDLIDRLMIFVDPSAEGLFHSLLGDRLNLNIDKEPSDEGLAFKLIATAPLMQGDVKGKVANGVLTLQDAAVFNFNLAPDFVNSFTHHHFKLLNPSPLKIVFSSLSIPLSFFNHHGAIDPCLFAFKASVSLPQTELEVNQLGKLSILSFQAHADAPSCNKTIQITMNGKGQQGSEPFEVDFQSSVDKPSKFSDLLEQAHQSLKTSLKISHFPLKAIPVLSDHSDWIDQIGSSLNAQLTLVPKGDNEWAANISMNTPRFALKEAKLVIGERISLTSPASIEWQILPNSLAQALQMKELTLDKPSMLHAILKDFQFSLVNPSQSKFHFESTIPLLQLSQLISLGTLKVQNINLIVKGENFTNFNSQLKGQAALLTQEGIDSPLLKEPLKFSLTSHLKKDSKGNVEMPFGQIELKNGLSELQIEGRLLANHQLELSEPARIQYTLTPSGWDTLSKLLEMERIKLKEPSTFKLSVEPASFDLNAFSIHSLKLKGKLLVDRMVLQDLSGSQPVFEDVSLPWEIDGSKNNFYADVKGLVYADQDVKASPLTAHFQLWPDQGNYDFGKSKVELRINFERLPTSVLNMAVTTPDLAPLFGPVIDCNFKTFIDFAKEKPGYFDLSLDSLNFHFNSRLKLNHAITIFDPHKLPSFRLTITPESFDYLKKILDWKIEQKLAAPMTITGTLPQFSFPLQENLLDHSLIQFHLSSNDIKWKDDSGPPFKLEGKVVRENPSGPINFSIQAISNTPLTLQGTLKNLFNSKGTLRDWKEIEYETLVEGKQLTPAFLRSLFFLSPETAKKLQALLGDRIDLNANLKVLNLSGPIQATLKGSQGEFNFDGALKEGILKLNKPLEGSLKLTPLFTQTFLAPNVPLLSSAVESESPIKFMIDPSQFSCPLIPFQLENVKIGKGTLDLGKIRFRNEGELSSVLSFIHKISDPYFTIWFTPLYFQLDKGILNLKRLDLLVANSYTLAAWGSMDLNRQQADLVLGLSGYSLQYAFGIQGLDEKYIFQIPLHSEKGKVELDKKKTTARITALIAQSHGGTNGKILGSLLDMALSNSGEAAPPPTTQPFPWKGEFNPSSSAEKRDSSQSSQPQSEDSDSRKKKKRKKSQNSDFPIKGLEEGAGQILDHIFGK